jgi:hypothetical protein
MVYPRSIDRGSDTWGRSMLRPPATPPLAEGICLEEGARFAYVPPRHERHSVPRHRRAAFTAASD